jgi:hypothetical protein
LRQEQGVFKMRLSGRRIESPATGPTFDGPMDIISLAHDHFVGAEDDVLAALAKDLPDFVTACQFSG